MGGCAAEQMEDNAAEECAGSDIVMVFKAVVIWNETRKIHCRLKLKDP